MNLDQLYPYLVATPPEPGADAVAIPVGHGVWVRLFVDTESAAGVTSTAVTADQLRAAGLTPEDAHDRALANLACFADESPDLSVQVLGEPGGAVHLLLYCDHPRAAACLLLPDLYEEACDRLQTAEVCAVVPQRDALVILPKRDRAFRDAILARLRDVEADAAHPLGFGLFELTADGVREFGEA